MSHREALHHSPPHRRRLQRSELVDESLLLTSVANAFLSAVVMFHGRVKKEIEQF